MPVLCFIESMQTVRIESTGAKNVTIDKLIPMQGDLKTLPEENYQRLKSEILNLGFSEPIAVWDQGHNTYSVLNGHQRLLTLNKMRDEGYIIPAIPVSLVKAKDEHQAKLKILSLTAQYGIISDESLKEYAVNAEIELGEIAQRFSFPEVKEEDIQAMADEIADSLSATYQTDLDNQNDASQETTKQIVLYYSKEEYNDMIGRLEALIDLEECEGYSQVIQKLVKRATD